MNGCDQTFLSMNIVANVAKETTTKGLMKALCDLYEKPSANNKVELKVVVERILFEEVHKLHVGEGVNGSALSVGRGRMGESGFGNSGRSQSRGRDSRASFHTMHERDVMVNYVFENYGTVHLADGEQLDVVGMRYVNLSLLNGSLWKLTKKRLNRGSGYREKQVRFDMGVSMKIDRIIVGKIPVLDVLRGPREVLMSCANEAALKVRKVNQLARCNTSFGDEFESEGTLGKDATGFVLHESSVLVGVFQSRDQRKLLTWNGKAEERNSLMTNQAWRFSKVPGLKIMKIKKAKSEHDDCLNEGKVQRGRGNGYSRFSSVVKLVHSGMFWGRKRRY
ncbi:hypothetical protein LIER_19465 [Lithospermum erythrorhizon]|uniref:Uncharacterized protein n=1 Tax=Lithospermum erythrorhizon TaxID=34254 RepID=A0AAV3QLN3_LITER